MNITNQRQSLPLLWLKSFAVVNRSVGKLLGLIGVSVLVYGILIGIALFSLGGVSGLMGKIIAAKAGTASGVLGLIGAFGIYIVMVVLLNIYSVFFFTVLVRIFAAEALQQKLPFSAYFSSSIIPTLWQIVLSIIIGVPVAIVGIIVAIIFHGSSVGFLALLILFIVGLLTIGVRLAYTYLSIILKNNGPIEAFRHSWFLTENAYLDTLAMLFMTGVTTLLFRFVIQGIFYALKVGIPLYFANSFSFTSPLWWAIGLVVVIICIFLYLIPMAFPVLVFLNRDSASDPRGQMITAEPQPVLGAPLPAEDFSDLQPHAVPENHVEEGLPPSVDPVLSQPAEAQVPVAASQPENPAAMEGMMTLGDIPTTTHPSSVPVDNPAGQGIDALDPAPISNPRIEPAITPVTPSIEKDDLDSLQITQSSINTSDETVSTLDKHLDQVYTPSPDNIVQRGDEDRMPTILFDDEMAKELEDTLKLKQPDHPEDSQDSGSIKLSK